MNITKKLWLALQLIIIKKHTTNWHYWAKNPTYEQHDKIMY